MIGCGKNRLLGFSEWSILILGVPRLTGFTPNIGLNYWVCYNTFSARFEAKIGGDLSVG